MLRKENSLNSEQREVVEFKCYEVVRASKVS